MSLLKVLKSPKEGIDNNSFMRFIIFDLEATCWDQWEKKDNETIEIGAVMVNENKEIVTNGGRVLNVCALGHDLEETRKKVYDAIENIHFDGMYMRKDIGLH